MTTTSVLIVDDDARFRCIATWLLRVALNVTFARAAGYGEEALRLARELRPDAVLIGAAILRYHGAHAAWQIRAESPESRVVVLTEDEEDEKVTAPHKWGADAVLRRQDVLERLLCGISWPVVARQAGRSGPGRPGAETAERSLGSFSKPCSRPPGDALQASAVLAIARPLLPL